MKKITGENFGSISSTEEVGKPEQETKSAVIELDSPEALEKVWISFRTASR